MSLFELVIATRRMGVVVSSDDTQLGFFSDFYDVPCHCAVMYIRVSLCVCVAGTQRATRLNTFGTRASRTLVCNGTIIYKPLRSTLYADRVCIVSLPAYHSVHNNSELTEKCTHLVCAGARQVCSSIACIMIILLLIILVTSVCLPPQRCVVCHCGNLHRQLHSRAYWSGSSVVDDDICRTTLYFAMARLWLLYESTNLRLCTPLAT